MDNFRYPIVKTKTTDGIILHGFLSEPASPTKILKLHLHGTAGNFYWNEFYPHLSKSAYNLGVAYLSVNSRGAGVYEVEKGTLSHGASLEKFEDCVLDIDAWIDFAAGKGYTDIILEGHSFGTEKSVYYMNKGKHVDKIKAVILLGFSDNIGTQKRYLEKIGKNYLEEAKKLTSEGKDEYLISDMYGLAGELPISARTYLNFLEDSENAKALPLRNGKNLVFFRNIRVPILGIIGDKENEEYTIIPIVDAIELLKNENNLAEVYQIKDCNHGFDGKEEELATLIEGFIKRRVLA